MKISQWFARTTWLSLLLIAGWAHADEPYWTDDSSLAAPGACATCGPAQPLMDNGCSVRPSSVQFTFDFLVMDREGPDSADLFFDTQTGGVLLNTESLVKQAEPGVRLGLILFADEGCDIEFGYLGLDKFGQSMTIASQNPITFPFFGGVPANPQNEYTASYLSQLDSGEVNLRRRFGNRLALLAGFRFLELRERFEISSSSGTFDSTADNDLYGFQLGGDVQLLRIRRSMVFATIKSGVYYNNADVSAEAAVGNTPIAFIDDEDEVAFVGDVAFGMLIPMGSHADLRVGYQGLYLDGIGLAPDQSDNYDLFTSSGSMDTSTLLYHGGFVGVDLFW